jgi:hypothetical protein
MGVVAGGMGDSRDRDPRPSRHRLIGFGIVGVGDLVADGRSITFDIDASAGGEGILCFFPLPWLAGRRALNTRHQRDQIKELQG